MLTPASISRRPGAGDWPVNRSAAGSRVATVDDPANAMMSVSVRWLQWSMAAAPVSTAIIAAGPGPVCLVALHSQAEALALPGGQHPPDLRTVQAVVAGHAEPPDQGCGRVQHGSADQVQ